jgi:diguanylate cyclase (GGDEF)-like protein/PAS domain S-box-containing protein
MKERRQTEKARLESLLRISQYRATSLQDLLNYALKEAIGLTQSEIGYIYFYNDETRQFTLNTWSEGVMDLCNITDPQTVYDLDKTGMWGEAVRQARPIVINDFTAPHPLKKGYPEGHAPLSRFMTVPVFSEGRLVAVLGLANKKSDYLLVDTQQATLLMGSLWQVAERKRFEDALIQTQLMLTQVISTLPVGVFWKDTQLKYVDCNANFARDAGFNSVEEVVGRTDAQLAWSDRALQYGQEDREVISSGLPKIGYDEEVPSPSGQKRWLHKHKMPIRDAGGKVIGVLGTYEEITGVKKDQLRISRLAAIVDASEDAIIGTTPEGTITDWNRGAERIFGYLESEITGKSITLLSPPDKQDEVIRILKSLMQGRHIDHYETRRLRKSGEIFNISLTVSPIYNKTQKLTGLSIIGRDVTERKKNEAELERYRDFLENIADGCFETDLAGTVTYANESAAHSLGYTREEYVGMNYRQHSRPEEAKRIRQLFGEIYRTGQPAFIDDFEVIRKNKQLLYVEISASLICDAEGKPIGFRGTSRDITSRKQIQDALEQSEARYRNLFQYSKAVMLLIDPDTANIVDANLAACDYYRYTKDELLHKKITDLNVPGAEDVFEEMQQAGHEQRSHFYFRHRLANGDIRPVEVFSGPVTIGGKQLLYSIIHDITERRKAEQALRESEERYRSILENISEGYFESNLQGKIIFANDAGCAMMGYDRQSLYRMNYRMLTTSGAKERFRETYRNVFKTGIHSKIDDYEIVRGDGTVKVHQLAIGLIRDAQGNPMGFRTMARDVTEHKQAEEALRQSEERIRLLFNNIPVPTFVWKAGGEELILAEFNGAALQFIGDRVMDFVGRTADQFFKRMPQIPQDIRTCLSRRKAVENHFWYSLDDRAEKRYVIIKYAFAPPDSVLMHVNDITGQKHAEEKLQYISIHDSLTGLFNRFYADAEIIRLASSRLRPVSVIIIDLNDLKKINDEYGHAMGDMYIKNAATLLKQTFRPEDMTARIGGDEFLALLPLVDEDTCAQAIERLNENIRTFNSNNEPPMSLSAGHATVHADDNLPDRIREADRLMYQTKALMKAAGSAAAP